MLTRGTLLFIGQRVVLIGFTILAVSSVVFLGIHRLPGDSFFSERLRGDAYQQTLHHYGLDLPLQQQYFNFVGNAVFHGDLGESLVNRGVKVTPLVLREAVISAEVGGTALIFTVIMGMVLGVMAAVRQNTWVDYLLTSTAIVGYSMPNFVIASFLLLILGIYLQDWTGGAFFYAIGWDPDHFQPLQVIVPALALGFPYASFVARLTRASMLEVIRQDYVRTARAKGLSEQVVVIRHALRNALIPVVTILGPLVIGILTGSVVIEKIFGIPGLGKEFASSILNRDYNIVIGVFTVYAALVGVANLGVDLLYTVIDPRIRY
ncbi:MAG: oligopeptide transport system permease protein [Chloroflexota bacterium]|jgi:oligopeptide transport system permease protein|nr:oligopeptide transport system permease protein [Chloroflexota bacterium]